jgi:cell division protein FtsQ
MTADSTASRFLRPPDVARLHRNQRRVQMQRLLAFLRTVLLVAGVVGGTVWGYRHTQSDARFAVRSVEVSGTVHTPSAAIEEITSRYVGANLFRIDLERVRADLRDVAWVRHIDIEKTLPDALRIHVAERAPVALLRSGERLLYVDEEGVGFAELSPVVGDDDLPIISESTGGELLRTIALLRDLQADEPEIYSRISEITPVPPRGFSFYDRGLSATVHANAEDLAVKFRSLHAILRADNDPAIEYADLRFANRVVIKPYVDPLEVAASHPVPSGSLPLVTQRPAQHGGGEYVQD